MAQTFSVHDGSLDPVTAKVSAIWWLKPSSAARRGPMGFRHVPLLGAVEHLLQSGPVHDQVVRVRRHLHLAERIERRATLDMTMACRSDA